MTTISEEQLQDFHEAFSIFDQDGDGRITKDELRIAMRSLGQNPTEDDLDEAIKEVDANGSGTIELDEFVTMMSSRFVEVDEESELRQAFQVIDRNGNGFISHSELKFILTELDVGDKLSEEEIEGILIHADGNGDGQIDYKEFVKLMTGK